MFLSLYLVGDLFYSRDGYTYLYASFSDYLPTIALVMVLWCIIAAVSAMMVWLTLRIFEWFCARVGWKIKIENSLIFIVLFVVWGSAFWIIKRLIIPYYGMPINQKIIVFLCVSILAASATWKWLKKGEKWLDCIQVIITPLVLLFGILAMLSIMLVTYNTWG